MKKAIAILAIVAALIVATAMSGCTSPGSGTATPTPAAGGDVTATPAAGGETVSGATGAPKVTYDGDNIKIAGSQPGTFKLNIKKGGYIVEYKHKGYSFDFYSMTGGKMEMTPGGQYPDATTGWAEFAQVEKFYSEGELEFSIDAKDSYEVNFKKLPLSASADAVPKTYTDSGLKVVGPMTLQKGTVNLKISAPDLSKAGFTVELFDATTGESAAYTVPPGIESNKIDATVPLTIDADGTYLLEVSSNAKTTWTVEVSQ